MSSNQHEHLSLNRLPDAYLRRKRRGRGGTPNRDHKLHSSKLTTIAEHVETEFVQARDIQPSHFDPALIFRVKLDEGQIDEANWQRLGLQVLSIEPDKAIILFSSSGQLDEFRQRVASYGADIPVGQKNPSYKWLSIVSDLEKWGPKHRIGSRLRDVTIQEDEEYTVDVELWFFDEKEACRQRLDELKRFIQDENYLDEYLGSSLCLARLKITGKILNQLLHVDSISIIDLPPKPDISTTSMLRLPISEFPEVPNPPPDAPRICVIDSGLARGHPLIGPAVGDTIAIPESLGTSLDDHGHGTMVGGLALYGDIKQNIADKVFSPDVSLFSVRVTNSENRFDDSTLIVNQMTDAIEQMSSEYNCRVFNISLGDPDLVFDEHSKPSFWATILDELARIYDIVIVVAAGNRTPPVSENDPDAVVRDYPHYLLDDDARIIDPAMAVNVLTVGALALDETSYWSERNPRDPSYRTIAGRNEPSPFTRRGPGVENSIKPDLCEYGGNLLYNGRQKRLIDNDLGTGIVSAYHQYEQGRLFGLMQGTSFAAPRVAHMAARIIGKYPKASANLVRALLAASADVPDEVMRRIGFKSSEEKQNVLNLCGYGKPDISNALYSSDSRVTLFCEDILPIDSFHIYEIPLTDEFKFAKGKRCISVTLAFDPPVRRTRRDYMGNRMSFKVIRGRPLDEIIETYRKTTSDELSNVASLTSTEKTSKMWPKHRERHPGTLQKSTFDIHNKSAFKKEPFYVVVWCEGRWAAVEKQPQKYALAITMEHLEQINIYNSIRSKNVQQADLRIRV